MQETGRSAGAAMDARSTSGTGLACPSPWSGWMSPPAGGNRGRRLRPPTWPAWAYLSASGFTPRRALTPTPSAGLFPISTWRAASGDPMTAAVPKDVMVVGSELAIVWEDGSEAYIPLEKLRRACPCAMCKGEKDIFGNVYKGKEKPYTPSSFKAMAHRRVGGYALQIDWGDRHNDGIYSWDTLRRLAEEK